MIKVILTITSVTYLWKTLCLSPWHFFTYSVITAPLTDTGFLVIFLPAFLALVTVLIGCSSAGLARRVAFCRRKWNRKPQIKGNSPTCFYIKVGDESAAAHYVVSVLTELYLYTGRRCRSSLRWSSHRCSLGRTPPCNRGHSCTSRSLRVSHRHHTFHFHDRVSQSPQHRLKENPQRQHKHKNIEAVIMKLYQIVESLIVCQKQNRTCILLSHIFPHHYNLAQTFPLGSTL